jgi:hypothetical protein
MRIDLVARACHPASKRRYAEHAEQAVPTPFGRSMVFSSQPFGVAGGHLFVQVRPWP